MTAQQNLRFILAGLLFAASGSVLLGQNSGATNQAPQKTLEKAPVTHSNPASRQTMFKDYCAACHGPTGKGNGPAAELLKTAPPDLTMLAKSNGGKFPSDHFVAILHFGTEGHAHGTSDMPVWGPLFRAQKSIAELRINHLEEYAESIQQK